MALNNTELRELYGPMRGRSKIKVLPQLEFHSRNYIAHSPFVVISTFDKEGNVDTSPRGGSPGFVKILDEKTILLPDSKGNNRVDSLTNISQTGRIGTLFMIPGVDETLRINGAAEISTEQKHLDLFNEERNLPKSVLVIHIEELFMHCAKAFMRSKLWSQESQVDRKDFPTMDKMLNEQLGLNNPPESQEDMVKRYEKDL